MPEKMLREWDKEPETADLVTRYFRVKWLYERFMLEPGRILKIKEKINSLNVFPKAYPLIDERKGIRKVTVDNYNIYYKVYDSRKTVHIISVIHSKMNQQAELRKLSDSE